MITVQLTLTNYGPFRGVHKLKLEPLIYSLTARAEDDPERSNWIGKSWLLSAFRFALYGVHPARTEDTWITDGEPEGSVQLDLEGGASITRARRRGRSTQLELKRGGAVATQDRAQEIIDKLVGFDRPDFDASCWIKQKGSNAIVVAEPAARTRTVVGWMDLEPLQAAEKVESTRLLAAVERDGKLAARAEQLRALIESVGDPGVLVGKIRGLEEAVKRDGARLAELYTLIKAAEGQAKLATVNAALEKLVADGQALKATMQADEAGGPDLGAKIDEVEVAIRGADLTHSNARTEADRIGRLVVGVGFDGVCPVVKTHCPATDEIRAKARTMSEEHAAARQVASEAMAELGRLTAERARLAKLVEVRRVNAGRLQAMRDRAKELLAEIERLKAEVSSDPLDGEQLRVEAAQLQAKIGIDKGEIAATGRQLSSVDGWVAEQRTAEDERKGLEAKLRTHREALIILGRNGAQREIAEGNLAQIEGGANELLGGAGIDLSVKARWGREGSGLASHCQACGQPFPPSAKIKECQTCGAARGPKLIEKLELELSSSSDGAAEDVAGLAMQLSAATWLRARRQAPWSAVFIDEPYAACDARIGAQLAARLRAMLGGRYSFRQAFIISHSAALTDSMPGRIQIVKLKDGSLKVNTE